MAVNPYIWGKDKEKDKFMLETIQAGKQKYWDRFDSILEQQYGIKKSDYMGDSFNNLTNQAQTGGKQAVDNIYRSNTPSPLSRNPISSYNPAPTATPKNMLPWTQLWRYGDTGGANNAPKYSGKGVGVTYSNVRLSDVAKNWSGFLWNDNARNYEKNNPGYLTQRNDFLANAFYNDGVDSREWIAQYLQQFWDFANANQVDKDNTVTAIWNRIGEINKANTRNFFDKAGKYDPNQTAPQNKGGNISDEEYWNFVNTTLKTNFDQFWDLDQLKKTYGDEAFYKLKDFLNSAKWAYDLTNPEERNRLAGDMQSMLWSFIGTQSDLSKLNLAMESGLSLFSPESQQEIKSDLEKMGQLEWMGMNAEQIASKLWWTTDKVYQLNLLKQGSNATRLWKYYNLSDSERTRLSEEADIQRQRLKEDHEIAMQRQDRDLQWLTETHQKNYERQKRQNEINEGNANMLAGLTGIGFSSRGMQGLQEIQTQAKEILDDMTTKYERGKIQINDIKMDLMRAYQRNDADIIRRLNESLVQAKNAYISGVASLQSKYGLVSLEGQKALAETTKNFIESAQKFYLDASKNSRENLKTLIDGRTNLMNYEYKQIEYSNAKKKQFMSESMYMTPAMAMQYAQENGFADQIDQVLSYQLQATVNTLESYAPWTGMKYQGEVQALLNKWYTPAQAISNLMERSDFSLVRKDANKTYAPITIWKDTRGVYDPNTQRITYFDGQGNTQNWTVGGIQQDISSSLTNFSNNHPVGSRWGQCGSFVNDYLQSIGGTRVFTDPITDKKSQINSTTPTVWSIAIMNSSKYPQYGHVAIVTAVNEDGSITTLESNRYDESIKKWDEKVFTRTFKPSSSGKNTVYGYYTPGQVQNTQGGINQNAEPLSSNGIPITYEQKIYNLVPTSLKNSDTELKNLYSKAKQLYESGMSPEDAVLTFMGFKVNEKDKPFANTLIDYARGGAVSEDFYGKLSDYINKGNKVWAMKLMENGLKANTENKGNVRESTAISMIKMIRQLEEKMAEGENKFWPISGKWNKWYSKRFGGEETQKINSSITAIYSQLRNEMNGSNVTDSETKWLEPLIPSMDDKYENVKAKIATMKNKILADLNGVRQDLNLPQLDQDTLLDSKKRLALYEQVQSLPEGNKQKTPQLWFWWVVNGMLGNLLWGMWRR